MEGGWIFSDGQLGGARGGRKGGQAGARAPPKIFRPCNIYIYIYY